MTVTYKFTR